MDKNNRHGFEPRMFETFMLSGTAALGLAWIIATPVAFGQEHKDSPQRLGVAPATDSQKDRKKKAGEVGDYKDMKKESDASVPAERSEIKKTIGTGDCPVKPCDTKTDW